MKPRGTVLLAAVMLSLVFAAAGAPADGASSPWTPPPLALLPLTFERVEGEGPAAFAARGHGYAVHVTPDTMRLTLSAASVAAPAGGRRVPPAPAAGPATVVSVRLAGANPHASAVSAGTRGTHHYLTGSDASTWRTHVPTHSRVRYVGVYPGIDVVYYGTPRRLEFDLVVAPGADPRPIALVIETPGEAPARAPAGLGPAGDIILATAAGELRLLAPVLYQEVDGARRSVDGRFAVRGRGADGALVLGFEVGDYDRGRPLVIDPVLSYSTYVGGTGTDAAMGIAVDASRNVYVTGYAGAAFTPLAGGGGAFGPRGGRDVFVTKLDPTGSTALYTTYVGGDGTDEGMAIAVDSAGQAYVTGSTDSSNWPLVNHFQSYRGGIDAFLFKLGPDGSQLLYSTIIGGALGDDAGLGIAADAAGRAWVTGYSGSSDFPASVGDPTLGGTRDAFVTKIDTVNTAVNGGHQFSTLLGGSGSDEGQAIAVDGSGNIFVTGSTTSVDFPTSTAGTVDGVPTYGAFSATLGGPQDAFVTRLNAAGTVRVYSTYLGGTGTDTGYAIAVDTSSRAYVTGATDSTDFPVSGAYQATRGGSVDAFVTRINTLASGAASRLNTTYLGGSADDIGLGIAIDGASNAYVTGWTASAGPSGAFPTLGPTQETYGGGTSDAFVAKLAIATSGSGQLVWSTFLGGAGADSGQAVTVDAAANAYVGGVTSSAAFPLVGGLDPAGPYGGDDAFVAKFGDGRPDLVVSAFAAPASGGSGSPVSLTITVKNQGEASAGASTLRLYFSEDLIFSPPPGADPELGSGFAVGALAPGATVDIPATVTLPVTTTGTRYLFAVADADSAVGEALENNNRFTRSILIGPDLAVSSLTVSTSGTQLTISDTTINQGVGLAAASTTKYYFSTNTTLDAGDQLLGSRGVPALDTGASSAAPTVVALPAGTAASTYYIIALADADNAVVEANEANNTRSRSFPVGIDLSVSTLTAPLASGPGLGVSVDYTVVNNGAIASPTATLDFYLSTDTTLDPLADTFLTGVSISGLAAGASSPGATAVTFPADTPMGTYSIIAKIDGPGTITETNENNNVRTRTITLGTDLVMYFLNAPSSAAAGATITISETVRNTGGAPAGASTTRIYLSPTATLDLATARLLVTRSVGTLGAGVSDPASHSVTVPSDTAPGTYHIIAVADADGAVAELNEGNNTLTKALTVNAAAAADLTVSFINATAAVVAGATFNVSNTVKNSGAAPAPASTVRIHLSTTTAANDSVLVLATRPANALAPGASHNASTSVTIPAATPANLYYLVVEADAGGEIAESNENNNTGSKSLAVSLPDLTVSAFSTPSQGEAGGTIAVNDTTRNGGLGPSPASITRFYLSSDPALDASDPLIGSRAVPELAVGATSAGTATLAIPGGYAGSAYVIAKADGVDGVIESNETNNTSAKVITVVGPDLAVSVLGVPAGAGAGSAITVSDTTANLGGGSAGASTTRFYLSTDAILDGGDVLLGARDVPTLAGGVSSAGSTVLTVPGGTATGTYYLIARADAGSAVIETNEANNVTAQPFTVGPDLVVLSISVPSGTGPGMSLTINDSTRNQGGPVTVNTVTRFYLSTDTILDGADVILGSRLVEPLAAGAASTAATVVTVPAVPAGNYYVLARADADHAVVEVNEGNNVTARAILVGPDLSVSALTAPTTAGAGATISVSDTTSNDSLGAAPASTTTFYLSTDAVLDAADVQLGSRAVPALAARSKNSGSVSLTLPAGISGTFYLIAKADAPGGVDETDESNNTRSRVIELGPDLTVTSVSAPSAAAAGATITVQDTTKNAGIGAAPATTTRYYLSTDSTFDAGDTPIGSRGVPALAQGASSTGSAPATLPTGIGGDFYIIAVANADSTADADPTNNARARLISIGPDFIVTAVTAPAGAGAGSVVTIGDSTRNTASAPAPASFTHYYLSPAGTLEPGALYLGSRSVPALAAGATSTGSVTLTIPSTAPSGRQYIIAKADGPDAIPELSESNNTRNRAISIGPNLWISSFTVPAEAAVAGTISVTDTVSNDGAGTAFTFTVGYYLSANTTIDATDTLLGSRSIASLGAGASSTATTSLTLPAVAPGRYYVVARADSGETVSELDEGDNNNAKAILIGPDLVVSALSAATSVAAGATLVITDTTLNQGAGLAGPSTTTFYLSTDNVLNPLVDIPIGTRPAPALDGGASSAASTSVTIPAGTVPGSYYIIAKSDGDAVIAESVEINNTRSRTLNVTSP